MVLGTDPSQTVKEPAQINNVVKAPPKQLAESKLPHPQEKSQVKLAAETRPVIQAPPIGSHESWMAAVGISQSDYSYVEFIISHESSWRPLAVNPRSGATGICQALPAAKMSSAGLDYMTNPVTQLKWCNQYAIDRYGSWANAYGFWRANAWW